MKRDFYTTPKSNWLMRALWSCAGADAYILERSTYTDHVKYACLGGIVFATGFMAAMAGGYAFYMIFEPRTEAITTALDGAAHLPTSIMATIFGIIWGLIIFNIDRFIVASTGKGDGTEAITWSEIKGAIPRIIMGMIIAITISKPVEIRMFQTEINVELQKRISEKLVETQKLAEKNFRPAIVECQGRISECEDVISAKVEDVRVKELNFTTELDGSGGTGRRTYGPVAAQKEKLLNEAKVELEELRLIKGKQIDELKNELAEADAKLKKEKGKAEVTGNSLNGLLARIQIAHDIAGIWITLFITLLFMAIELTPIFFKMMLIKSPYDFMSDNIKSLLKAEQGIEIKYDFYKDQEGVQRDLVINHQADHLMKEKIKLLQTQHELSEVVMENWKTKETKNIKDNPESYIEKNS
jgi:hypothetical protein